MPSRAPAGPTARLATLVEPAFLSSARSSRTGRSAARAAFRPVLACELVATVRALRLRGIAPVPGSALRTAYDLADAKLNSEMADRQLSPDVEVAVTLLEEFADL